MEDKNTLWQPLTVGGFSREVDMQIRSEREAREMVKEPMDLIAAHLFGARPMHQMFCSGIIAGEVVDAMEEDLEDNPMLPKHNIRVLRRFHELITEDQQDLPPEFSKLVDKHFWDLV